MTHDPELGVGALQVPVEIVAIEQANITLQIEVCRRGRKTLEWFRSRAEARVVIETWRRHYNAVNMAAWMVDCFEPDTLRWRYAPRMTAFDLSIANAEG